MLKLDDILKENIKNYNTSWPKIPDHPCIDNWRFWIWKIKSIA